MKIRYKIFFIMLIVTILPLIILGGLSLDQSSKIIKTRVLQQLKKLSLNETGIIGEYFNNLNKKFESFKNNDHFQIFIRYFDSDRDIGFLQKIMESSFLFNMKKVDELSSIRFYDKTGKLIFNYGKEGFDLPNIEQKLKTNTAYIFRNRQGTLKMIFVNAVSVEGIEGNRGYLVFGVEPSILFNLFDSWNLGEGEEAVGFIIDNKTNQFFAHTKESLVLKNTDTMKFEQGLYYTFNEGEKYIYVKSGLENINYLGKDFNLYVSVPLSKFMLPVKHLQRIMLWIAIITFILALVLSYFMANTIVNPIEKLASGANEVASGNLSHRIELKRNDELGELTDNFNEMTANLKEAYRKLENKIELVNADLAKANEELKVRNDELQAKQKQIAEELDFARLVQEGMLPDIPEKLNGIELAAKMTPAKAVGGDFYAYDFRPEFPERISIGIGDVSGKGVPAALLMVAIRDQFQSITKFETEPGKILNALNKSVHQDMRAEMFVTFLNAEIDAKNKTLKVSSGGHHPAMVYRKATGEVEEISSGGIILGMFADIKYQEKNVVLNEGDVILLYTDGVIEAATDDKDMYGIDKLREDLKQVADDNAGNICYNIYQRIQDFIKSAPQYDDITLIVAKIVGGTNHG